MYIIYITSCTTIYMAAISLLEDSFHREISHYSIYLCIPGLLVRPIHASSTSQLNLSYSIRSFALYGCFGLAWCSRLRRQRKNAQFLRQVLAAQRACKLQSEERSLKVSGTQFRRALNSDPCLFMLQSSATQGKHFEQLR